MRISDWSSDVCSSDLEQTSRERHDDHQFEEPPDRKPERERCKELHVAAAHQADGEEPGEDDERARRKAKLERDVRPQLQPRAKPLRNGKRSEEHTSELQSLMRSSYAVFCLTHNSK